jgi:hypothetical protein
VQSDARWLVLSKPLRAPLRDGTTVLASTLVRALPTARECAYLGDPDAPLRPGLDRVLPAGHVGYAPGLVDKARLFATLVDPRLRALDVHLFFSPNRASQSVLAAVRKMSSKRRFVQTIPASEGAEAHVGALRSLDAIVVTSEDARDRLGRAGLLHPRLECIHPGITVPPQAVVDPAQSRKLLYAGDLDETVANRLIALGHMLARPELGAWTLVLACRPKGDGDATARARIRRELADAIADGRVEVLAEVDDMDALLRSASLQLYLADHTRKKVDLPLVLLEGLARGIGLAALDVAPVREIFDVADDERLDVGLRLPVDADAAALAVVSAALDADRLRAWGSAARRLALQRFSDSAMAARYVELYAQLERLP